MTWQQEYLQRYYYSRPNWQDGTREFWALMRSHIPAGSEVLELGCGPDNPTSQFLSETFPVLDGLDIDEDGVKRNPHLRNAYVYDGIHWPMDDECYDAIISDFVLEHVEHPKTLVQEIKRVLRPGGVFLFRAPGLWHYVTLVARLTPHSVHEKLANRLRNLSEDAEDPYPTFYRMNSQRTLRKLFAQEGFQQRVLYSIEKEPYYGLSMKPLFLLFMLYERVVNSAEELSFARSNILGVFQKPKQQRPH